MTSAWVLAMSLAIAGPPAPAAKETSAKSKGVTEIRVEHCVVVAIDDVPIPSQEAGLIADVLAKDGVSVNKGDLLVQIDDTDVRAKQKVAEAELKVATEQATNNAELDAAMKTAAYQKIEYDANKKLNSQGKLVSDSDVRKFKVMWERAESEARVADMKFRIATLTEDAKKALAEQSTIEVERRKIKAPFGGYVERVLKRPGAWVQPGEQVLRLVRMDKVRVEGFIPVSKFSPADVADHEVTIEISIPRHGKTEVFKVEGKIDYVSQVVESGNDIRVFAEVDNQHTDANTWLLRPGATVEMIIR